MKIPNYQLKLLDSCSQWHHGKNDQSIYTKHTRYTRLATALHPALMMTSVVETSVSPSYFLLVILSHRHSDSVSLEMYPLYQFKLVLIGRFRSAMILGRSVRSPFCVNIVNKSSLLVPVVDICWKGSQCSVLVNRLSRFSLWNGYAPMSSLFSIVNGESCFKNEEGVFYFCLYKSYYFG